MSVAFRRESDDEHKEPVFEIPIPVGPNIVTPRGRRLIADKVAAVGNQLDGATSDEAALPLRRELRYWQTRLATAEVAPRPADAAAAVGSRVSFRLSGAERVVEIVGADEADPAAGRLGYAAPLARALIGAEAGDRLDFNGSANAIEVLDVSVAEGSFDE